jgi:hypothetical protein
LQVNGIEPSTADGLIRLSVEKASSRGIGSSTPVVDSKRCRYLAQHEGAAGTVEKLRWLLQKAVCVFGERLRQLRSPAIAA